MVALFNATVTHTMELPVWRSLSGVLHARGVLLALLASATALSFIFMSSPGPGRALPLCRLRSDVTQGRCRIKQLGKRSRLLSHTHTMELPMWKSRLSGVLHAKGVLLCKEVLLVNVGFYQPTTISTFVILGECRTLHVRQAWAR